MTEAEWLACDEPDRMLAFVRPTADARRLRLFACACCRCVWGSLEYERSRRAVETAERYADGGASERELDDARSEAGIAAHRATRQGSRRRHGHPGTPEERAAWLVFEAVHPVKPFLAGGLGWLNQDEDVKRPAPGLLRDLFGDRFRPPASAGQRPTSTLAALAQAAYEDRLPLTGHLETACLAVLSDALEEAGCGDADLLSHLRSHGPHVRGCWALDLILRKP